MSPSIKCTSIEISGKKIAVLGRDSGIAIGWSGRKRWFWPWRLWNFVTCSRPASWPVLWRLVRWAMYKTDRPAPTYARLDIIAGAVTGRCTGNMEVLDEGIFETPRPKDQP